MELLDHLVENLLGLMPEGLVTTLTSMNPRSEFFVFGVLILGFLGVRSAVRLVFAKGERRRYEAEIKRLELRISAAKAEAEIHGREDTLRTAAEFLDGLRAKLAKGDAVDELDLPLDWLEDLRPTLAEVYTLLARHALFTSESTQDFERARKLAWGALAAEVEPEMVADVLDAVQEVEVHNVFEEFTEAELLAWKIGRLSTETGFDVVAAGVIEKNRHRIGGTMLISGWEPGEIKAAALGSLDWDGGAGALYQSPANGMSADETDGETDGGDEDNGNDFGVIVPINKAQDRPGAKGERRRKPRTRPGARPGTQGARALRIRANAAHEIAQKGASREAEEEFHEIWKAIEAEAPKDVPPIDALTARHNMAFEMARRDRHAEAAVHFRAILEKLAKQPPSDEAKALELSTRHDLAQGLAAEGRQSEAEREFREVWETRATMPGFGPQHPVALWSKLQMLRVREALDRRTA